MLQQTQECLNEYLSTTTTVGKDLNMIFGHFF